MEPLGRSNLDQLDEMSRARRLSSLPHKLYCERQDIKRIKVVSWLDLRKLEMAKVVYKKMTCC
jgi:hypothetical protein